MPPAAVNPAHQAFILARLQEFCHYRGAVATRESDPWSYMRGKLATIEPELAAMKAELLAATRKRIVADLKAGTVDAEAAADFKTLLERLLDRGDFVDVALHLDPAAGAQAAAAVDSLLAGIKPHHAFLEERKPDGQRSPAWEKLVAELTRRLDLSRLGAIMNRGERTPRRRKVVLRRLRRNVAEYCTVVRIPTGANDTFTPFMLPRIEAVIAACLRFLNQYR
jgi:hypothetical protein